MSAFMVSDDTYAFLASVLICRSNRYAEEGESLAACVRPSPEWTHPRTVARAIVNTWRRANVRALVGRYGERCADMLPDKMELELRTINPPPGYVYANGLDHLTAARTLKAVQCIKYQCSEDVATDQQQAHEAALDEMERCYALMVEIVALSSPAYDAADWG